jgi:hypothetical protein
MKQSILLSGMLACGAPGTDDALVPNDSPYYEATVTTDGAEPSIIQDVIVLSSTVLEPKSGNNPGTCTPSWRFTAISEGDKPTQMVLSAWTNAEPGPGSSFVVQDLPVRGNAPLALLGVPGMPDDYVVVVDATVEVLAWSPAGYRFDVAGGKWCSGDPTAMDWNNCVEPMGRLELELRLQRGSADGQVPECLTFHDEPVTNVQFADGSHPCTVAEPCRSEQGEDSDVDGR